MYETHDDTHTAITIHSNLRPHQHGQPRRGLERVLRPYLYAPYHFLDRA